MSRGHSQVAVAAGAVALAVGSAVWFGGRPEPFVPVEVDQPPMIGDEAAELLTVYVSGEVAVPGLVEVAEGGRIAEAVAAAGGALPGAALDQINLAAPVVDGQQVVVPAPGSTPGGADTVADGDGRVHLNTATAVQLEELPGVGPVLAARIVEVRDRIGAFRTVEDLLDVPGIGEGRLATLREAVVVP